MEEFKWKSSGTEFSIKVQEEKQSFGRSAKKM
jgi:hypothetical protein